MKTNSKIMQTKRKLLYKLLDSFEEKEFYAVKNFAEFINTKNGKNKLYEILEKAEFDNEELSTETLRDLKTAKAEHKKGTAISSERLKKELGI